MKNACVIGYGAIGPLHADGIEKSDNVNLYGICDIKKERADDAAKKHNCKAFYDFDEVLKDPEVHSVHIATPHYLHDSMVIAAAEAGKEIVLEKPVSISLERMNSMIEKVKGKKVCVMLQNRMNPAVAEFKRLVDEDKTLGKLIGGFASVTWSRDEAYYAQDPWRGKWDTEGGGLLINQAIHLIDMVSFIVGDIKAVRGSISNKTLKGVIEVEDTADAIFYFDNDVRVCYYATNGYNSYMPIRLELQFENAVLRYADDCLYRVSGGEAEIVARNSDKHIGKRDWGNSHTVVINNFYNGGEYPDLEDARNAMTALFKFYESAKNDSREVLL